MDVGFAGPDVGSILLAGEAIYQLRSALDHLIHQLVIRNGQAAKLTNSRRHQFPIFETPQGYGKRAGGMIDGVSQTVSGHIAAEQPYSRTPASPRLDPLWILQDLNNTDKHRLIPVAVIGIGEVRGYDSGGALFTLTSGDIVLEDKKIFWSFRSPSGRYQDINADITCAVAFEQAMTTAAGMTMSIDGILWRVFGRVRGLIDLFGQFL